MKLSSNEKAVKTIFPLGAARLGAQYGLSDLLGCDLVATLASFNCSICAVDDDAIVANAFATQLMSFFACSLDC